MYFSLYTRVFSFQVKFAIAILFFIGSALALSGCAPTEPAGDAHLTPDQRSQLRAQSVKASKYYMQNSVSVLRSKGYLEKDISGLAKVHIDGKIYNIAVLGFFTGSKSEMVSFTNNIMQNKFMKARESLGGFYDKYENEKAIADVNAAIGGLLGFMHLDDIETSIRYFRSAAQKMPHDKRFNDFVAGFTKDLEAMHSRRKTN